MTVYIPQARPMVRTRRSHQRFVLRILAALAVEIGRLVIEEVFR